MNDLEREYRMRYYKMLDKIHKDRSPSFDCDYKSGEGKDWAKKFLDIIRKELMS